MSVSIFIACIKPKTYFNAMFTDLENFRARHVMPAHWKPLVVIQQQFLRNYYVDVNRSEEKWEGLQVRAAY